MARRTKGEIMAGVDSVESRFVDHNTVMYHRENGERVIRLHLTDIVTYQPNGDIVLNTGGWNTITTKDRINKQLELEAPGWRVWSDKGELYLSKGWEHDCPVYHWHDGITLYQGTGCNGKPYDKEQVKRANAWQRRVKRYSKKFVELLKAGEIGAPGPGDCWFCCMVDTKGRSMGEHGHSDHIHCHIIEKYYVPSLVMRAIDQFRVSQVAQCCLASVWHGYEEQPESFANIGWEQIEKAIYRYCRQWAPYNEDTIKRAEEEVA